MSQAKTPYQGRFPFSIDAPELEGQESAYVQWIRNHSSYLTVGSLATKLGSVTSYIWGIALNFIVVLPLLILISLGLGYIHFNLLAHPYFAVCIGGAVFAIVANLITAWAWWSSGATLESLRTSWWAIVSAFFGWILLGLTVSVLVVLTSHALEWTRDLFRDGSLGVLGAASVVLSCLSAVHVGVGNFPMLAPFRKTVKTVLVGIVGFVLLWLFVVWLSNFVIYGNTFSLFAAFGWTAPFHNVDERKLFGWPLAIMACVIAVFTVARLRRGDWMSQLLSLSAFLIPALLLYVFARDPGGYGKLIVSARKEIGQLTRPLSPLTSKRLALTDEDDEIERMLQRLREGKHKLGLVYETQPRDQPAEEDVNGAFTPWARLYFGLAQRFADNGYELLSVDPIKRFEFWQQTVRKDRELLVELALQRDPRDPNPDELDPLIKQTIELATLWIGTTGKERDASRENDFKKWILSCVDDDATNAFLAKLHSTGPSALKQNEFAKLMGREGELTDATQPVRDNSAFPGAIPYLSRTLTIEGGNNVPLMLALQRSLLRQTVAILTNEELKTIENDSSLLKIVGYGVWQSERQSRAFKELSVEQLLTLSRETDLKSLQDSDDPVSRAVSLVPEGDSRIETVQTLARREIVKRSIAVEVENNKIDSIRHALLQLSQPIVGSGDADSRQAAYATQHAFGLDAENLRTLVIAGFPPASYTSDDYSTADKSLVMVATGTAADFTRLASTRFDIFSQSFPIKYRFLLLLATFIGFASCLLININATSIHGFYRNRLSQAFLIGSTNCSDVKPLPKLLLSDLAKDNSTAPYTLINTAINLQRSSDLRLRDQKSDFFLFSKFFCGGDATGYTSTTRLETADRTLSLGTAMTISAAAASPNMGRMTNPFAVMLLTLLNVRLGYWIPNPRRLSSKIVTFDEVFVSEWSQAILPRWNATEDDRFTALESDTVMRPSVNLGLVGLAFSGGGIRSAALNMGVSQQLETAGVFSRVDYLSSVSGGGYTGASIAAAMMTPTLPLVVPPQADSEPTIADQGNQDDAPTGISSEMVNQVKRPLKRQRRWHNPIWNLAKEMISCLHERSSWVNLSDGGHIENLATVELLRRRCHTIIIGDGEADPDHTFNGVGNLIQMARIELGVAIELDLDLLRLGNETHTSAAHWAIGRIHYPARDAMASETGYLIYLKSSVTGDEPEDVLQYRSEHPAFPHEPTSDQFFAISQFEAYRTLGMHMTESMLEQLFPPVANTSENNALPSTMELRIQVEKMWNRERQLRDDASLHRT